MVGHYFYLPGIIFFAYWNALQSGFAYDDNRAILENADVTCKTPWSHVFFNDYWGTSITHSGSHKSYRPLCVATFRLNFMLHQVRPFGFHLVNVLLHVMSTLLFYQLTKRLLSGYDYHGKETIIGSNTNNNNSNGKHIAVTDRKEIENGYKQVLSMSSYAATIAAILFATHPIHTEAVTGLVGRADVGCCFFYLLSLLSYMDYCQLVSKQMISHSPFSSHPYRYIKNNLKNRVDNDRHSNNADYSGQGSSLKLVLCLLCAISAMLMKEQGITVLGICIIYDIFILHRQTILILLYDGRHGRKKRLGQIYLVFTRSMILVITGFVMMAIRWYIMGSITPSFSSSDNPASHCDHLLTRILTFNYLPAFNVYLLLYPNHLNFDWSMNAIPLIQSIHDFRNFATLLFYTALALLLLIIMKLIHSKFLQQCLDAKSSDNFASSHLQCNGHSYESRKLKSNGKGIKQRSNHGNGQVNNMITTNDHHENHQLYSNQSVASAGIDRSTDWIVDILIMALALLAIPFLPACNLFFYVGFVVAERVLYIPSLGFCLLITLAVVLMYQKLKNYNLHQWVNMFVVILALLYTGRTISRNDDWFNEESLYKSGIQYNPPKALANLGNVLSAKGDIDEAEKAYKEALFHRPNMADTHYNLGILLQNAKRYNEALQCYEKAIEFRKKLAAAYLNMGVVYEKLGKKDEAIKIYRLGSQLDDVGLKNPKAQQHSITGIFFNLGTLLLRENQLQEALDNFMKAVEKCPEDYPVYSIYNMIGETYNRLDKHDRAELWFKKAITKKVNHLPAYLTYAKSMASKGNLKVAERLYKTAIQLKPENADALAHYGQFLLDHNRKIEGAEIFGQAARIAPNQLSVIYNAGNAFREAELYSKAEEYFKAALNLSNKDINIYVNLGAINHIQGKLDEAEHYYSIALKLNPDNQILLTNMAKLRRRRSRNQHKH
ncbi:Transmembrane and TPR repeat-containing protein 2 [Trichoplax sp. H2]|nr:Transmembrane and TPR repeat-containing protein 2 [Trichoplax sp. H2]|eukprot:RDD43777.1 Transmembrane and TPR repeat-containing protein 2 [Trichoplax sp. H2]